MVNEFLELLSEMSTVDCTVAHPVIKTTVVSCFGTPFGLGESCSISQPGLILDRTEDLVDGSLEWIEADFNFVNLNGVRKELS